MTWAARLILFAVFAVAGGAKLFDRGGQTEIERFGIPPRFSGALATGLPVAELMIAIGLLVNAVAWWATVAAMALLACFCAVVTRSLVRGEAPECHCFGQLDVRPVGWGTVARNLLLVGVGAAIAAGGQDGLVGGPTAWIGRLNATQLSGLGGGIVLAAGLIAVGAFTMGLLRQNGRLLLRIEELERRVGLPADTRQGQSPAPNSAAGLEVGAAAPGFTAAGPDGRAVTLHDLLTPERMLMLVFTDPRCGACRSVIQEVGRWQRERAGELRVALMVNATAQEIHDWAELRALEHVYLQPEGEISALYGAHATPMAVAITGQGVIASGLAGGADAIRSLVDEIAAAPEPGALLPVSQHRSGPRASAAASSAPFQLAPGDATPPFTLPGLDGNQFSSAELGGTQTLLMFWNPACVFCRAMLDDIRALEKNAAGLRLVLISTADRDGNLAMALSSTVLLDEGFGTAPRFGARGTPSAILLDEAGRIASHLASGREQIENLLSLSEATQAVS